MFAIRYLNVLYRVLYCSQFADELFINKIQIKLHYIIETILLSLVCLCPLQLDPVTLCSLTQLGVAVAQDTEAGVGLPFQQTELSLDDLRCFGAVRCLYVSCDWSEPGAYETWVQPPTKFR